MTEPRWFRDEESFGVYDDGDVIARNLYRDVQGAEGTKQRIFPSIHVRPDHRLWLTTDHLDGYTIKFSDRTDLSTSRAIVVPAGAYLKYRDEPAGSISLLTDRSDHKRLIVLRHGKAAYPPVPDHERPLAQRGNQEAPAAGRWLVEQGIYPDAIITSDAVRTRQTTTWVISELGDKAPTPYLDSRLYMAPASEC